MPAISDRLLARRYQELENKNEQISGTNVLPLLAAVADHWYHGDATDMLSALAQAKSKQEQLDLVKRGLSKREREDIGQILDHGTVQMSAEWRNFFEAAIGRAPLDTGTGEAGDEKSGPIRITGDMKHGISGIADPGVTIEAINLSTAPAGRLHLDDTVEIAKAGADGKFTGQLIGPQLHGTQDGDLIRLRTRDASGKTSDWVTVRASGLGTGDTRNAVVALFRIGLSPDGAGSIAVDNINSSRPLSEPGAVIQFKNERTGETFKATIDDEGQLPKGFSIKGQPGDRITVAASDGKNNVAFKDKVGELTVPDTGRKTDGVDLPDPDLHPDELDPSGKPRFQTARFTGPLFVTDPSPKDVAQGQIGNCYFPSALAAIAQARPDAIKKMITDNGDGTYSVTFKERNYRTGGFKNVKVDVDGDLYVRSSGSPLYGSTTGDNTPSNMELWYPIVEKAYAAWKGGYDEIGNGGSAGTVFEEILGEDSAYVGLGNGRETAAWRAITAAVDGKNPAALGTHDDEKIYKNTGVYANHSYSVIGYKEENGERYVQIRNPWGESEPAGNGANDGFFYLELSEVVRLFSSIDVVR